MLYSAFLITLFSSSFTLTLKFNWISFFRICGKKMAHLSWPMSDIFLVFILFFAILFSYICGHAPLYHGNLICISILFMTISSILHPITCFSFISLLSPLPDVCISSALVPAFAYWFLSSTPHAFSFSFPKFVDCAILPSYAIISVFLLEEITIPFTFWVNSCSYLSRTNSFSFSATPWFWFPWWSTWSSFSPIP